jgi:hypothetical protein
MAMAKIGGPIWLGTIGMLWGITAACFASLRSVPQFLALRFLLGVFEAGALPGMWSYLSHFYSRQRITIPLGEAPAVEREGMTVHTHSSNAGQGCCVCSRHCLPTLANAGHATACARKLPCLRSLCWHNFVKAYADIQHAACCHSRLCNLQAI